jgi:hypothetical protein
MSMNPGEVGGQAGQATAGGWPTDDEILALAKNEKIPLYAEAYAIAQQYNRISQAFAAQLGTEDLSWCGFAKWSSKAIGSELRLNEHSPFFRKLTQLYHLPMLSQSPFRRLMLVLMGGSYSVGLSTANRSIFVEMASFHTQILSGADPVIICQVMPEDPNRSLLTNLGNDGLDLLRTVRDLLRQARSASGPLRSELILGASIALSAYEQKRVQRALEYVFYRGPRWCLQVSWRMPYYYLRRMTDKRQDFYLAPHDKQSRRMQRIEDRWVRVYSRSLWLKTAISTIMLSKPLVTPRGGNLSLLRPAATFKSQQVAELVQRYGPPDITKLTGVANWLDYQERMRFIITYFMLYQQIQKMFEEPRYKQPRRSRRKPRVVEEVGRLTFKPVEL